MSQKFNSIDVQFVVLLLILGCLFVASVSARRGQRWQYVDCYTNQCIADTLNGLPDELAAEAKLTTWNNSTYVWFRR